MSKIEELKSKLGVSEKTILNTLEEINPLRVVLTEEFRSDEKGCHRERSIKRCMDAKIDFSSECNTIYDIAKTVIKVINPLTGNEMVYKRGGGSMSQHTMTFVDEETKDEISVTLQSNSFSFNPKK